MWAIHVHLRKMSKSKSNHSFPIRLFQFRVQSGWSLSQQLRAPGGTHTGQDALPSQGHTHTPAYTHLRLGQLRHANSPHVHIFGMWEETRIPGENLWRHRENNKPHRQQPWLGIDFFCLINIIVKWCYSRTCYTVL